MIKACNLQKGNIVALGGQPHQVRHIDVQTPSARGANTLYKVRFNVILTGQKVDQTYKGNDTLEEMEMARRPASFLYADADQYTFMDSENYEQYTLHQDRIEEALRWITEGMEGILVLLLNDVPIGIELPASVELEIVETEPAIKGMTATNRNKPAALSNGVTVMVPEYLSAGDTVRVNTATAKFMARVR